MNDQRYKQNQIENKKQLMIIIIIIKTKNHNFNKKDSEMMPLEIIHYNNDIKPKYSFNVKFCAAILIRPS